MESKKESKNGKMSIDKLARMTQNQFSDMGERFDQIDNTLLELKEGQKRILDIVIEIPSKKAFQRLEDKVERIDVRLTSVERKVK